MVGIRTRIHVLQKHIDKAKRAKSGACMVQMAIKEAMPETRSISVDLQTIRWTNRKSGLRYIFMTPRNPVINLVKWDQGVNPEPFDFTLNRGQVISAKTKQQGKLKLRHKLGRKRVVIEGKTSDKKTLVHGGKAPPRSPRLNHPADKTRGNNRVFGIRALTFADIYGQAAETPASNELPTVDPVTTG